MQQAERMRNLPPYLFARIEQKIAAAKEQGVDVISLGIGDPDRPTPPEIVQRMQVAVQDPANHRYPSSAGLLEFRQAVAAHYRRRFNVTLDPGSEVVTLIGSKEGIAHIALCYLDPGDTSLVPDPGYPVYEAGTLLAGGRVYPVPLKAEHHFLPDLSAIPSDVAKRAKLFFLNYPNNPTGAVAPPGFFAQVVEFARSYDLIVCHDAAYSELTFNGYCAPSFLETPGAKEVGIEFGSLSKPYNMTGWRLGWAVGRSDVIEALGRLKSNLDSGVFQAAQQAGITALTGNQQVVAQMVRVYQERRDALVAGLNQIGWRLEPPQATFYLWAPVPRGYTSAEFAELVLERAGVVITPGNGYGANGEGFCRMAVTVEKKRILEAVARLKDALGRVSF